MNATAIFCAVFCIQIADTSARLGPKKRTEKLLAEIGEKFSAAQLEKLHAPVGLDIGAETPETIALSIVAEIQSVLAGREGGFLREREGAIYERQAT